MKPIVVGIDFSESSINALEHAVSIAKRSKHDLVLVFVKKPDSDTPAVFEKGNDIAVSVKEQFEKVIAQYQPELPDVKISYAIREGKVAKEMVAEAREKNAFLVVVGTHGASGFEEFWAGSNANRIVSDSPCPTITIRGGISIKRDLTKIILPIDSTLETRQKLPFTSVIADLFDAEVILTCLYTTRVKAVRNLIHDYALQASRYLTENAIRNRIEILETNNLVDGVLQFAEQQEANLISIMTEMEKSTMNIWLGSYAQQFVNRSPIPVLTIHAREILMTTTA